MKYDVLYNFISPVTGRIKIESGHVLIGDADGFSTSSLVLVDMKQDIIDLRRNLDRFQRLDKLDHNRIWIGDYDNEAEQRLQIGIINLPILSEALFPNPSSGLTGDFRIPNPTFDYLSPFDWVMSGPFLPQIYATKYDTFGNPVGTDVSSSLAMTQVRVAQIMKRFDNANFIVGSSTVTFDWENPKMYLIPEPLRQLYNLGTTYTFTKAQSLGALGTGLLKNTVNNGTGTLSQAISGQDYVNTADITIGNLVILDPLYPLTGHKLIAPTGFSIRGNTINEFGEQTADTISVLTGIAGKFTKFAITSLIANSLIKVDEFGELKPAIANTDYTNPSEIVNILSIISAFQTAYDLFVTVTTTKDAAQDVEIVSIQAKDITQDVEIAAVEATATTAQGTASTALSTAVAAETSVATLGVTVETEIAALAGVETLSILATILGFIGVAAGGKGYGDYIRGQTLNVKNTWKAADLNDEGHNAVGDYEFRFPSGYSSDDRGHSTLWFDSKGRANENQAEAGLRLFSWDSGGDHIGTDDPISPLHIGLFGYQNKYHTFPFPNPTAKYKGFIFSIPDFHNESSSDDNYRFPKRFGLYDVTRTIGTWTANKYGWDSKNTIFEYDYIDFNFYKPVVLKEYTKFEKEVGFQANVKCLGTGALKIPVGDTSQRPSALEPGMIRFNVNL